MKPLYIAILLFLLVSLKGFSNSKLVDFITIKGYVTDLSGNEKFADFPVIIYPNLNDITEKYTVYTNKDGFYFFTYSKPNTDVLITLKGNCEGEWIEYTDTILRTTGVITKNFKICHNPLWYIQDIVIDGFVYDSIYNVPVAGHPIAITQTRGYLMSVSCYTDATGYYKDTIKANIFDSLKINISTYSFCDKDIEMITKSYSQKFFNLISANFMICSEPSIEWNVAFFHNVNYETNEVYFYYIGNFDADSVLWDFGDNTYGSGTEIFHTFEYGSYNVRMTAFKNSETKKYEERIFVGRTFSIEGTVYASGVPIEQGYVIAVINNKSSCSLMNSCQINNGFYTIEKIMKGDYYIYAIPEFDIDTIFFPKYIATYFDGAFNWQNSNTFHLEQTDTGIDINLYKSTEIYFGENSINIYANEDLLNHFEIVNVLLFNSSGEPINSLPLSTNSRRSFNYLPEGNYSVKAQVPGYDSKVCNLYLYDGFIPTVNFYLNGITVDYTLGNIQELGENDFFVYPNPFKNFFVIESEYQNFDIEIYDINGKLIEKQTISNSEKINTNINNTGIYFLILKSDNLIIGRKMLIKN